MLPMQIAAASNDQRILTDVFPVTWGRGDIILELKAKSIKSGAFNYNSNMTKQSILKTISKRIFFIKNFNHNILKILT